MLKARSFCAIWAWLLPSTRSRLVLASTPSCWAEVALPLATADCEATRAMTVDTRAIRTVTTVSKRSVLESDFSFSGIGFYPRGGWNGAAQAIDGAQGTFGGVALCGVPARLVAHAHQVIHERLPFRL